MSDISDYRSIPDTTNEYQSELNKPKTSGLKQPSGIPSLSKVSRLCSSHDKKPELPPAATPKKNVSEESEYDLYNERYGLGSRSSSKSKSPDSFRLFKYSPDRKSSSGVSSVSPDFFEATGRRSSSDHGADLTIDTDSFMIGQRVYVGGVKPGRITFIGEVHFAPGEWAGIVLDEPEGKNDGAVSGKRYFQCEPKKGIFSRLTRLTREPLSSETPCSMDSSFRSMTSPLRMSSGNTSPTQSVTSASKAGTKVTPEVNDRVIVKSAAGSKVGILRYRGEPHFASGTWCGVEFDEPVGKNDGSVSGQRYFKCPPNHGLFVPAAKVEISPLSRKFRLSRQNSQDSLISNLTLGSMTSTNTSKLRMNATQKRLSTLSKTPTATSTPKPTFSLQDILREKSNHIEKIMKERETDREEMAAQTILFQKNIEQHKEKISHLEKLLEDEKKRSEDLQFSIDEAQAQTEENEIILRKKVSQLEEQLKSINSQAAGDFVDTSQSEEIAKLKHELGETSKQLHIIEGLKATLENQVHNMHKEIAELKLELDIKTSGDQASEAVLKDEISYLAKRVEELETALDIRTKELETKKEDLVKIESSRNEELTMLENQTKEKIAVMITNENSLMQKIAEREKTIEQLKIDVENLSKADAGVQDMMKAKNDEISKLSEASEKLEGELKEIQNELEKKSSEINSRDEEISNLRKLIESQKEEISSFNLTIEQHEKQLKVKEEEIVEHKKSHDNLSLEIVDYKFKIDHLEHSLKKSEENSVHMKELTESLTHKVTELSESKAKLEQDLKNKDSDVESAKQQVEKLIKEKEEIQQNISGLSSDAESKLNLINEKNQIIEELTKDLNELKEKTQSDVNELQAAKKALENQIELTKKSSEEEIKKLHIDFEGERKKMNSVIDELNGMIREKEARIDVMNKNSNLLDEKKSELEAKVSEFEMKYSESFAKLKMVEKEESEKSQQLEKLQSLHADTIKKLQEAEITNKKLLEDKNAVEVDNKDLNRKLGAQEEKVAQLTEQKLKLQQDIESLKNSSHNTDDALKKLNEELIASQSSFESFQSKAKSTEFELQRRIDELENQRDLANQNCEKLKSEIQTIQANKIECENSLNTELASIKQSTEEDRKTLEREIVNLKSTFENEKAQLKRESQELLEASDKLKNELEAKIKSLKENLEDLQNELKLSKESMVQSESRMGVAIDELKAKESQLVLELNNEKETTDKLKSKIEELEAAKTILRDEYEEKLFIEKGKTSNLEGQLKAQIDNLIAASAGNEEKIKFLDELQQKCYKYEQQINLLNQQVQNEISLKEKLENGMKDLQNKLKSIEEEQVDLVNRKEEYKIKTIELQEEIKSLQQRRASLDEKITIERKESEIFKSESDAKISEMQKKLNELNQAIAAKDFEKEEVLKRLQLREDEIGDLHTSIKQQEEKLRKEIESTQGLVKIKENELQKMAFECSSKDNLVADLQNNLENLKTCLKNATTEKDSTTDVMDTLKDTLAQRESTLNELRMKLQQMESGMIDKERQLENAFALKEKLESETRMKIEDLMEQISILEDVKHRENQDWSNKLSVLESQLSIYQNEAEASSSNMKLNQKQSEELLLKIKDLEISETELRIANQTLKRQIEELQSIGHVPKVEGEAENQDLVEHIEFLNSIIADMHKKNLKLTKQVQVLETGPSSSFRNSSGQDLDLSFLDKKKPQPRMYCDICEEFDAHETEDCPTQCGVMDPDAPAPTKKDDGKKRKPVIRKYCDNCEVFDAHDTEDCPNSDETF